MTGVVDAWRVRGSRLVVDDAWLRVRADSCQRADGRVIEPYYVLERPGWISVLAVTVEGEALLVREYRHGAGEVCTGLIGGTVEATDADPAAAAARELAEETGAVCQRLVGLGATWANWANHDNRVHHFLALGCRITGQQVLDATEEIDVVRRPLRELYAPGALQQSLDVVTWHLAMEHLPIGEDPGGSTALTL
jgi:ADP-ribose pyrophosphatase